MLTTSTCLTHEISYCTDQVCITNIIFIMYPSSYKSLTLIYTIINLENILQGRQHILTQKIQIRSRPKHSRKEKNDHITP